MNSRAPEEANASDPEVPISGPGMVDLLQGVLARGAGFRFRASGGSMFPFIRDGDVLLISPFPGAGPALGRVIAFAQPSTGNLVVHRLVGRRDADWLVKGDNCSNGDFACASGENLLGVVVSIERNGARVRFGLGMERALIAVLSRANLLSPLIQFLRKLKVLTEQNPGRLSSRNT